MLLSRSHSKTFETKSSMMLLPQNYKPCASDILCGRGRSYAKHHGNKRFSNIVKRNLRRYIRGRNRTERRAIVGSIVDYIGQQGFRFIKLDSKRQRYYQLGSDVVHEKTGHAIRDLIKLNGCKEESKSKASLSAISCFLHSKKPSNATRPPVTPLKTVSPDSQHGDYENQSSLDYIGWFPPPPHLLRGSRCSLVLDEQDEKAAMAQLALSIELRQFPEDFTTASTWTALSSQYSTELESCNSNMLHQHSDLGILSFLNCHPTATQADLFVLPPLNKNHNDSQEQEAYDFTVCEDDCW